MNDSTPRVVFAVLCLIGLIAILCSALFEFGRQKRAPAISSRHFRWRMVSAILWTVILGSLAYATLFLWPVVQPGVKPDPVAVKRFANVLVASMSLMMVAFIVIGFDFYLTAQTRRIQSAKMQLELAEIARLEIERAQKRASDQGLQVQLKPGETPLGRQVERQSEGGELS